MTDWFTADELAHLFGWTPGYVRKMASLYQWRRTGRAPTRFLIDDVMTHRERTDQRRAQAVGLQHARQES